jgi:catechol 2,3-dioxygenase-like lactoylglutathione lyase family enzyme
MVSLPNPRLSKKPKKLTQTWLATILTIFAAALVWLGLPGSMAPAFAGPGGTYAEGWVMRFNVADVESSTYWYIDKLGMELNQYSSAFPYYSQVFFPENEWTQIGLSKSSPVGSGKATATIVVSEIEQAKYTLEEQGVFVQEICSAGGGVALAFFRDPDCNNLALRQDRFQARISLPECGSPLCG